MARKKYKVLTYSDNHVVHEVKTSLNIFNTSYFRKAEQVANNCNTGGGFNGHTPGFFVQQMTYKYNEDLYDEVVILLV